MAAISIFKPKTKLDKQIQTGLIVVLIAIALWYFWQLYLKDQMRTNRLFQFLNSKDSTSNGTENQSGSQNSSNTNNCSNSTELKKGVNCSKVKELQKFFNERVASKISIQSLAEDGVFGDNTQNAVELITGNTSTTLGYFKSLINANPSYW